MIQLRLTSGMSLRLKYHYLLTIMLLLAFSQSPVYAGALEDKSIHWILLDFPPFVDIGTQNIDDIDFTKVQGALADIQKELVKNLNSYNHSFQVVTFQRAEKLFISKKNYCTILFLKTPEREKYMIFGDSIASTLPPGIVLNLSKSRSLASSTMQTPILDLADILNNSFRLGVVKGRAFSPEINKILKKNQEPTQQLVTNKAIGSLFKMLLANRLDGVISYYLEFTNEQARNPAAKNLTFHPLRHNQYKLDLPVACEKSPWGEKMVKLISQTAKKPAVQKRIALLLKQTIPPETHFP